MTTSDHLRIIWPERPHIVQDDTIIFMDGLPMPSSAEMAATQVEALVIFDAQRSSSLPPITRRQLRLWLHRAGLLSSVPTLLASLSEPAKSEALIEWADAAVFERHHPLVIQFATALGLTDTQLNQVWITAADY